MRVRCGSCRTEFEVAGAGRYACPVCGSVNVVRDSNGNAEPGGGSLGGYPTAPGVQGAGQPPAPTPPPPPQPEAPMPKIQCPECDFTFVIGPVAKVTCPNCSSEIETGIEEESAE